MRLPAEWEPQSGVQLTWPHTDTDWFRLDSVQECYVRIASAIQKFEPLVITARNIGEAKADILRITDRLHTDLDIDGIRFFKSPLNDTWARDHGGISVFGNEGGKLVYDFVFNGWGLKFASSLDNWITRNMFDDGAFESDVSRIDMSPFVLEGGSIDSDGSGTLLTTARCLCSRNRNDYLSREGIESKLKKVFGLERVLWLERGGIIGDDTDSHVDILARFCSADTIAYTKCYDSADANYEELAAMEDCLKNFRTADGNPYNLIPLPLPDPLYLDDYRLPASYANFLIVNGGVLVPGCCSRKDEIAGERLQDAFPGRKVVVVDCRPLLSGHGSLHCVTMQYPYGWLKTD